MEKEICSRDNWSCVGVSVWGEAVLCKDICQQLVTAKVKSLYNSRSIDDLCDDSIERVRSEATITNTVHKQVCDDNGDLWFINVHELDRTDVKIWLQIWRTDGDFYNFVELSLLNHQQYFEFMKEFSKLVLSINYKVLRSNVCKITFGDKVLCVKSVSDAGMTCDTHGNTVSLVGKNKYFTIIVSDKPIEPINLESASDCRLNVTSIRQTEDSMSNYAEIYADREIVGYVEISTYRIDNLYIKILGYWNNSPGVKNKTIESELEVFTVDAKV